MKELNPAAAGTGMIPSGLGTICTIPENMQQILYFSLVLKYINFDSQERLLLEAAGNIDQSALITPENARQPSCILNFVLILAGGKKQINKIFLDWRCFIVPALYESAQEFLHHRAG